MTNDERLLSEIRALREAQAETNTRLERVEIALAGRIDTDAAPGLLSRVPQIEGRVASIEQRSEWMWRLLLGSIATGVVTVLSALIGAVLIAT